MASNRARRTCEHEVFWMTAALINARDNAEHFRKLVALAGEWPDAKVIALADQIVPAPAVRRDRAAALMAIAGFAPDRELKTRIKHAAAAVALEFTVSQGCME